MHFSHYYLIKAIGLDNWKKQDKYVYFLIFIEI